MERYHNSSMDLPAGPYFYGYQNNLAAPAPGMNQLAFNTNTNNPFNGYFPRNPPPNTQRPGLLPSPALPPFLRPPPPLTVTQEISGIKLTSNTIHNIFGFSMWLICVFLY